MTLIPAPAVSAQPSYEEVINDPTLTPNHSQIIRLYAAVFARQPDVPGVVFWLNQFDSGDWSTRRIADFFAESDEFVALYGPGTSNAEFVQAVYPNVLGRAPDPQGFLFWKGLLDDGMPRGEVILLISNAPEFIQKNWLPSDGTPKPRDDDGGTPTPPPPKPELPYADCAVSAHVAQPEFRSILNSGQRYVQSKIALEFSECGEAPTVERSLNWPSGRTATISNGELDWACVEGETGVIEWRFEPTDTDGVAHPEGAAEGATELTCPPDPAVPTAADVQDIRDGASPNSTRFADVRTKAVGCGPVIFDLSELDIETDLVTYTTVDDGQCNSLNWTAPYAQHLASGLCASFEEFRLNGAIFEPGVPANTGNASGPIYADALVPGDRISVTRGVACAQFSTPELSIDGPLLDIFVHSGEYEEEPVPSEQGSEANPWPGGYTHADQLVLIETDDGVVDAGTTNLPYMGFVDAGNGCWRLNVDLSNEQLDSFRAYARIKTVDGLWIHPEQHPCEVEPLSPAASGQGGFDWWTLLSDGTYQTVDGQPIGWDHGPNHLAYFDFDTGLLERSDFDLVEFVLLFDGYSRDGFDARWAMHWDLPSMPENLYPEPDQ